MLMKNVSNWKKILYDFFKALFLEVLQGNLELTKQRIASDVLDNTLLPVLTEMLAEGPW